jgi:RNA polymerase sigma factor (sigma-70 family)
LTDGQLLERFTTEADEVAELAFSALVERHEALVWRVCLAILRDEHEAEDAFQATFLVLVRKARSLWVQDSLGPWLHEVAGRTASWLRTTAIRRRRHERRCAASDAARSVTVRTPRDSDRDAAVHEELNRLPEKYRAPIVLCDLEGRTHQEAAQFLGWPIGTVKSRHSQGRRLLRDRLMRRGWGLAIAGAFVESLRPTALAVIPKEVSRSTVEAAMQQSARLLTGLGTSAHVLTLTRAVLRATFWIRLRFLTVATVAVVIATGGASVYVGDSQEPAPKAGQPVSKQSAATTAQSPQPKGATRAAGPPEAATPKARLRAQHLATRKARASFQIAKLTRELAEIALVEYEEVNYPRDLAAIEGEIKLAESDLTRSEDRLVWAKRMFEKGYVSQAQKVSEELALQKARFTLEQAQSRRNVLVEYTRSKAIKELRGEVEKARSDELAKQAACEVEQIKELELEHLLHLRKN